MNADIPEKTNATSGSDKKASTGPEQTSILEVPPVGNAGTAIRRVPSYTTAYYAGWMQNGQEGHLPANRIDYSAVTSVVHFAVRPRPDGTLDAEQYGLTQTNITALMRAANTRRTPVLVSVGGDGTLDGFRGATSPARLDVFTTNLVNFLSNNGAGYGGFPGYAGIDVAWTPMQSPTAGNPGAPDDRPQYRAFITTLRGKLDALTPRPLLYASAVREQPALFAELQASFDQVNVRAYELAGPWPGQVTWHNSAVRSGGGTFPDPPRDPLPSIDGCIQPFLAAGVPASKLGLGLIFYGKHWLGVTQPQQRWTQPPVVEDIPFSDIMNCYHHDAYYRWDEAAQAAYLSISDSIWIKDCFISYDNEMSIQKKIDYAEQHRLGVFIWELGGGWRLGGGTEPGQGLPDYLLRFVKSSTRWVTDNRPPFFANPDKETL